jgi:uncharacterized membrane protein YheB (UPF0754 family)
VQRDDHEKQEGQRTSIHDRADRSAQNADLHGAGTLSTVGEGHFSPSSEGKESISGEGLRTSEVLPQARAATRARVLDLWALLKEYGARYAPAARPQAAATRRQPPPGMHIAALRYLRLTPFLLTALFATSFVWDFPGMSLQLWGYPVALEGLVRILSVSGLIGYLTNWLAVTMLFQPRHRRPLFGQGLIPAQRELVIYRLAQTISEKLINVQLIQQQIVESGLISRSRETALRAVRGVLEDPGFRAGLRRLVVDYIEQVVADRRVRHELVQLVIRKMEQRATGFSGIVLSLVRHFKEEELQAKIEAAIRELPGSLDRVLDRFDQLLDTLPATIEAHSAEIEQWVTQAVLHFVQQLDVYGLLIANMNKYDEAQLEALLKHTSNEQFNYIKYLGGVLGFFGGLVIWQPVPALVLFGMLGLALWLIDEALIRMRKQ